jgi:hypothetical protein
MNRFAFWKTLICLVALVLVSCLAGGLLGRRLAWREFERRNDASRWNEAAMRDLERALKPTPQQRAQIEQAMDAAVQELHAIRADTLAHSVPVFTRLIAEVEKTLTPEQRARFARMKPKEETLHNLSLLNVEPRKKP